MTLHKTGWWLLAAVISMVMAVPFLWMVSNSFKGAAEIFQWPPLLVPKQWMSENYVNAFQSIDMLLLTKNTLIVVICVLVLQIASSVIVAYGFARFEAPGSKTLFYVLLATMMLPWVVTMIPAYVIFLKINWVGTYLPLIAPHIGGSAFFIFMIRQFFMGIPRELDEAATIDGCGDLKILFRIILPNCKPLLATLLVFSFTATWSDYIGPSFYITDPDMFTLSLGLQAFRGLNSTMPWHEVMAACVIFSLPMVIIFFIAQNAFTKGIVMSGLKG